MPTDERRLGDRVAIVVGGATGVGAAAAARLSADGATVVIGDIVLDVAERAADELRDAGAEVSAVRADTADEESMLELVRSTVARYGRLDCLYSSAADTSNATIDADLDAVAIDLDVYDRTQRVNTRGSLLACRAAIPAMLASGGGSIVLTSSLAGYGGGADKVAYSISKAGIHALTKHVAARWGRAGIRCNTVVLGVVMTEKLKVGVSAEELARLQAALLVPEAGGAEQVAAAVSFLLSDEGSYINGELLNVDGGMGRR
jgi:NAD(P)-dependent dehydrogenase (short-subunit alcohol dehydrogenase family)